MAESPAKSSLWLGAMAGRAPQHRMVDGKYISHQVVELDHRSSGSLDVSLFWNRATDALFVQVIDWAGDDDIAGSVDAASAGKAFRHPFAYLRPITSD